MSPHYYFLMLIVYLIIVAVSAFMSSFRSDTQDPNYVNWAMLYIISVTIGNIIWYVFLGYNISEKRRRLNWKGKSVFVAMFVSNAICFYAMADAIEWNPKNIAYCNEHCKINGLTVVPGIIFMMSTYLAVPLLTDFPSSNQKFYKDCHKPYQQADGSGGRDHGN